MILRLPWISFFQRLDDEYFEKTILTPQPEKEQKIICRACQNFITSSRYKIEIQGRYRHILTNPNGFTFEIGCFSFVSGCVHTGMPTLEYTWFNGYSWQITLCDHCLTHLGWFYQAQNMNPFSALILKNLIQHSQ